MWTNKGQSRSRLTELCSIWSSQFSHYHVGLSLQSPGQGYPWQSDIPCSALGPGEHLQPRTGPNISTLSPHPTPSLLSSLQVAVTAYFFSMFGITVYMISDSVISAQAVLPSLSPITTISRSSALWERGHRKSPSLRTLNSRWSIQPSPSALQLSSARRGDSRGVGTSINVPII